MSSVNTVNDQIFIYHICFSVNWYMWYFLTNLIPLEKKWNLWKLYPKQGLMESFIDSNWLKKTSWSIVIKYNIIKDNVTITSEE